MPLSCTDIFIVARGEMRGHHAERLFKAPRPQIHLTKQIALRALTGVQQHIAIAKKENFQRRSKLGGRGWGLIKILIEAVRRVDVQRPRAGVAIDAKEWLAGNRFELEAIRRYPQAKIILMLAFGRPAEGDNAAHRALG